MELIVRHRKEQILHSGICIKQEIVQTESQGSALDVSGRKAIVPACICYVVWNQQIVSDEGEISYPSDEQRVPAVCLHYAHELIFEGIFNKEDEQDDDNEEYKLVGEYLEENHPDLFTEILNTVAPEENEEETEETQEINEGIQLVDNEDQKVETV
jgi:hypothetical protein